MDDTKKYEEMLKYKWCFIDACKRDCINIAELIYNEAIKTKNPIVFDKHCEEIFIEIFKYGNLSSIKYFYEKGFELNYFFNLHFSNEYLFRKACGMQNIDIAEWLYEKGIETKNPIDIHAENEDAFIKACWSGNLSVVKWLYEKGIKTKSPIDIHINEESAFRSACGYSRLKIMEYLYNLGIETKSPIDIHAKNERAFLNACENQDFHTVKWLYEKSIEESFTILPSKNFCNLPAKPIDIYNMGLFDIYLYSSKKIKLKKFIFSLYPTNKLNKNNPYMKEELEKRKENNFHILNFAFSKRYKMLDPRAIIISFSYL